MKDFKEEVKENLKKIIKQRYGLDFEDIVITSPKDPSHGDLTSNVAFKLAPLVNEKSTVTGNTIVDLYNVSFATSKASFIEPGFTNFQLDKEDQKSIVNTIIEQGDNFGKSKIGEGKKVMVEFGQPNTHKAFHIGHLKSAISGLSMVKLHENLGYEVIKVNFYGDVGMQVAKPTWAFLKKGKPEGFDQLHVHEKMKYIDECYAYGASKFKEDKVAEQEIRDINLQIYQNANTKEVEVYKELRGISLEHQNLVWESLGIKYDREYPESEVFPNAIKIVNENIGNIFEKSEGAIIYDGEKLGMTTWVFQTSEGNATYSSKDLALALMKFKEYPDLEKSIVTTSIEIQAYFKVVIHVLGLIKPETIGKYFHIPFGWMLKGGKKFSSRMGGSVKGMDVLNEVKDVALTKINELKDYDDTEKEDIVHAVANAGLKFLILSHEFHKDFSYEPDSFLSFEGFSGPYILYSYARAKSILRKIDVDVNEITNFSNVLDNEYEQSLIKVLSKYSEIAESAGLKILPHLIANYLYELSSTFNLFYTKCRVLEAETEEIKQSRLALTQATAIVLKNGLGLLGISAVEKM